MSGVRVLGFFVVVVLLSAGLHAFLGHRLLRPFELAPAGRRIAWLTVAASAFIVPGTFLLLFKSGRPWADALQWVGYVWMGLFSLIFVLLVARDLFWLLLVGIDRLVPAELVPVDPERRRLLAAGLNLGVLTLSGLLGLGGLIGSRRLASVVSVSIPIQGLSPALDGFRIAQISDLHVGPTIRAPMIRAIVDRVNELNPDLVALTGDLVDGPVDSLSAHVAPLADLRSRHGTWFITGNHEYYSGVEQWCAHVRDALGMKVLLDEHRTVEHDGATIVVAGVTDLMSRGFHPDHRCDVEAAAAGSPDDAAFRLLLAHQPESAPRAAAAGFHLQLSGHTHGGQYFPYTALIKLAKRWVAGLYRHEGLWIYVNRGTTYWGPPMRLGAPQEITLLELTSA